MIKIFEHFIGFRNVNFSGIILTEQSHNRLVDYFTDIIPDTWTIHAHHMTICLGELPTIYRDYRDEQIDLKVTHYSKTDNIITVKVDGFFTLSRGDMDKRDEPINRISHITIATNIGIGPKESNNITEWVEITPFSINGIVKEIEN